MMQPFDARQIREIVDEIESALLEGEQSVLAINLLGAEVESRAMRLATLKVAGQLDATVPRIRTACHELRSARL